jgi:hypothetical protein
LLLLLLSLPLTQPPLVIPLLAASGTKFPPIGFDEKVLTSPRLCGAADTDVAEPDGV